MPASINKSNHHTYFESLAIIYASLIKKDKECGPVKNLTQALEYFYGLPRIPSVEKIVNCSLSTVYLEVLKNVTLFLKVFIKNVFGCC